jgi:hypothetical protein
MGNAVFSVPIQKKKVCVLPGRSFGLLLTVENKYMLNDLLRSDYEALHGQHVISILGNCVRRVTSLTYGLKLIGQSMDPNRDILFLAGSTPACRRTLESPGASSGPRADTGDARIAASMQTFVVDAFGGKYVGSLSSANQSSMRHPTFYCGRSYSAGNYNSTKCATPIISTK